MEIDIVSMISSVGFPIAACIFMFKQNGKLSETLQELSNTLTLMTERIKGIEDKLNTRGEDKDVDTT